MLGFVPLVRRSLQCHPRTHCAAIEEVTVEIGIAVPGVLVVCHRIVGQLDELRIPSVGLRLDPERLWAHTCAELFVASSASDAYEEWNFSPTGQWSRFEFSDYRSRNPSSKLPTARLLVTRDDHELRIESHVPVHLSPAGTARLSPTAVVEDAAGTMSYWAMRHPCERPDFHHRDGFGLSLTLHPSPAIVDDAGTFP